MISTVELRRVADDVRWALNEADGELGLSSSFPAMVARIEVGGRTGGRPIVEISEHCLDAAERERPIRRALADLPSRQRAILIAAYGPGMTDLPAWRGLAGVVVFTDSVRRSHAGSQRPLLEWLVRLAANASPEARALAAKVRVEAADLLSEALHAFELERRRHARHPRRYDAPKGAA